MGGSSKLVMVKSKLKEYFPEEKIRSGHSPDLAVAIGAASIAYAASRNSGKVELMEYKLLDITTRSLGIIVVGNKLFPFIKKGSKVPITVTQDVRPAREDQRSAAYDVRESEDNQNGRANQVIGNFALEGYT